MKTAVYDSLHAINQATEQITEHIERLKTEGFLNPEFADIQKLAAEETCASVCHSAVLNLTDHEMAEAYRTQQEKLERERKIHC